jgi:ABC-2 type transport system permease protein
MNATTAMTISSDSIRATAMPAGRLFQAYFTEAKYECVRMLRMLGFALPFLVLPFALYLFVGLFLGKEGGNPKVVSFLFAGISAFGVMGPAMFGFGIVIATERSEGILALKRALPMPRAAYLLGKMLMAMLFAAIIMTTMVIAATFSHAPLTAWQYLNISVVNVLGSVPFCAIGMLIGVFTSAKSAPAIVNLLYVPMFLFGELWYELPKSIEWLAQASPAFHLKRLALSAAGAPGSGGSLVHIAVLGGLTLVCSLISVRRLARVG